MSGPTEYFTYRLTHLPRTLKQEDIPQLFHEDDRKELISTSIGPHPYPPSTTQVATVTFRGARRLDSLVLDRTFGDIHVDDQFHGLTPLNTVTATRRADVIAITGLAGRAFGSWQNEAGRMWLRDFLPSGCSDCRCFIYGYASQVRNSQYQDSIAGFTENFVREISLMRSDSEDNLTPLILVGHSLGCIIIKQAIVDSFSLYAVAQRLHQSVCGILLFGAPHRGLNNPELEQAVQGQPPDNLVRDLKPNSSLLSSLSQLFPDACEDIKVISCYETEHTRTYQAKNPNDAHSKWEKTGPPRFMVPPDSACLYWPREREARIAIHADHSGIAKLKDGIGSPYHKIEHEIKDLLTAAPDVMKRRQEIEIAPRNTLALLFMLQYEFYWFRAYVGYKCGKPLIYRSAIKDSNDDIDVPNISTFPSDHPAYRIACRVILILDLLGALLKKYNLHYIFQEGANSQQPFDIKDWNDIDREQLTHLLYKLRSENQHLSQLNNHNTSFDLMASSKLMNKSDFSIKDREKIERVSQIERLYSPLSKRISMKRQYEENQPQGDSPSRYPIGWIKMKAGVGSSNYRIVTSLDDKSLTSSKNEGKQTQWVLIEWRSYRMAQDIESQRNAEEQAYQLARDLSISNKPPLLKTLHCAGFVQDTDEKRFGFLFNLPDWIDISSEPRTLHSCLPTNDATTQQPPLLPTLNQRFNLARDLAYTLAELHGANILHKSIHSGNVLFFPARFTEKEEVSMSQPFLGGFEISRPDQKDQLSLDVASGAAGGRFDPYRHPELRDPSNELQGRPASQRKHDVYSLGLVLLEIGLWQRIGNLQQEGKSPARNAKRFLDYARHYLPHHMGTDYCEAVVACLDPESYLREEKGQLLSLEVFISNVIHRLEVSH